MQKCKVGPAPAGLRNSVNYIRAAERPVRLFPCLPRLSRGPKFKQFSSLQNLVTLAHFLSVMFRLFYKRFCIDSVERHELVVSSLFFNSTGIKNKNPVSHFDCGKAVADQNC
jgi:hypothetical protein